MQKIIPNLWFNGVAKEAAEFYTAAFPDGAISATTYYPATKEEGLADFQLDLAGKELTIAFSLADQAFIAINAGPEFTPTRANSFMINFDPGRDRSAREHLDALWEKLVDSGRVLMPLDEYPFSKRYGWVQDKYGYSWQLILTDPTGESRPFIVPSLMFGDGVQNRAGEAIDYYMSVFHGSRKGTLAPYTEDTGSATVGSLMFADFMIENQWFAAMDAGTEQGTTFTEAVSYVVICKDQTEIDYYWEKLSAVPESEQCGWCKDQFGVSWQIIPENMEMLMRRPGAYQIMMTQKKIVLADYTRST